MGRSLGIRCGLLALMTVGLLSMPDHGQAQEHNFLAEGTAAPGFTLPGATRYGILKDEISLEDYEGSTVVLVFFFRARTRG